MSVKLVVSFVAIIGLAACGGGGGGGGVSSPQPVLLPQAAAGSFNGFRNTETTLLNRFYNANGQQIRTNSAQMPTTGSTTFTGMAAFSNTSRTTTTTTTNNNVSISRSAPQLAARAVMTADFANGNVSGTIDQFRDAANTALPGTLTLGAAAINGNTYSGNTVTGTYPVNGTAQPVNGLSHSGRFIGTDASGIEGNVGFIGARADGGQELVNGTLIVGR